MSLSTHIRSSSPPRDGGTTAETLIDDLLLEIISRVPARHRWRCKCVCKHWLGLARKLPQSPAGFFYTSTSTSKERFPESALHFLNVSGALIYPSFNFLPAHRHIDLLDCCNGLLLSRWYGASAPADNEFRYVVCNPATEAWVALPDRSQVGKVGTSHLGFDPAVSSQFHVFLWLLDGRYISGMEVYSSETGEWIHKEKGWDGDFTLPDPLKPTVFLNGCLHFHVYVSHSWYSVPRLWAVDTDGKKWTNFDIPTSDLGTDMSIHDGLIQLSQGRLHYANFSEDDGDARLVVYTLEDYDSKRWVLKHIVRNSDLFGSKRLAREFNVYFDWIAIHPECNVMFFTVGSDKHFMCYNMDNEHTRTLCTLEDGQLPYLPYVPLYSELQSLHV